MSLLKNPNAVPKLMFHVTYLSIFQETQKFILFQKLHTGFVLSQISTFPPLEQRSCITGFFPACLSGVLRIGGLTPSLGVGLGECKFFIYVSSTLGLCIDQFIFPLTSSYQPISAISSDL